MRNRREFLRGMSAATGLATAGLWPRRAFSQSKGFQRLADQIAIRIQMYRDGQPFRMGP